MNSKNKRPLLRGILIDLTRWQDQPGDPAHEVRYALIAVWCPFCASNHIHGWNPANNGSVVTHRVAHCSDHRSSFYEGGYYISTVLKGEPGYSEHVTTPGTAIRRPKQTKPMKTHPAELSQ